MALLAWKAASSGWLRTAEMEAWLMTGALPGLRHRAGRLLCVLGGLAAVACGLGLPAATHAAGTVDGTTPTGPCYKWRGVTGAASIYSTPNAACETTAASAWNASNPGRPATYADTEFDSINSSKCFINIADTDPGPSDNGNPRYFFGYSTRNQVACEPACPTNATMASGQCSCDAGYRPEATHQACLPVPVEEATCGIGNPTQPGSGRKLHQESDYFGAGAAPLRVQRYYRSEWTDGAAASGMVPISAFGSGWRLSVHASLTQLPDGAIRAFRPDGTVIAWAASTTVPHAWVSTASRDTLNAVLNANSQRIGFAYTAAANDEVESYDLTGKLQSIRERNGWTTTLSYNAAGQVSSLRNAFGRETRFGYDAQGRLIELLPPGAVSGTAAGSATSPIRYAYAEIASLGPGVVAQSQLTSVTWQDGSTRRYHYEDSRFPGALTGITDEAGVRYATYGYDALGRVGRSEHAGGVDRVDFSYGFDASGRPTTGVADYSGPNGSLTSRTYTFESPQGVLRAVAVTAPCPLCGNTQASTSYDAAGNTAKTISHDGQVSFYAYDVRGRETERATFPSSYQSAATRPALSAATSVTSTQWHATWKLPLQVAEPGKLSSYAYDAKGNLTGQSWTATIDATGAQGFGATATGNTYATGWAYDGNSLPVGIVEQTGATETGRWTLTYDPTGDVVTETRRYTAASTPRADEVTRYTSRTVDGLPLQIVTADEKTATLTYKPRRIVDDISIASGSASTRTQFFHNAAARPTEVLLPDNSRVILEYSALGRLNAVGDTAGNRFQYTYAVDGSIQQRQDTGDAAALDRRVLAAYDPLGWAISGSTLFSTTVSASTASVADALALSTSKAKRASCIAACVAVGTYVGSIGGRSVGGAIGGTAGGVLGTAVPGVGNVALGTAGAIAGGAGGARAGAWAGSLAGGAVAAAVCPDDDDECEKQRRIDEDRCVAEAGARYGRRGVAVCMTSAFKRYSECLRFGVGGITTPLAGVETPL